METILRTLLIGVVTGSVYGLASTGLVLTYRISGVFNLGFGALVLVTSFVHWTLTVQAGVSGWLSAIVVVAVVAPAFGIALEALVFRHVRTQPVVIGLIVTVGVWVLLQGLVYLIWGTTVRTMPSLFPQSTVALFGTRIGLDQIAVLAVAICAAATLGSMLSFTRTGIAFRAMVDHRDLADSMGIRTDRLSQASWAISSSIAALTGILLVPRLLLDPAKLPAFVVAFVLGSAMLGLARSLSLAYLGGIILGVVQAFAVEIGASHRIGKSMESVAPFTLAILFIVLAPRAQRLRNTFATRPPAGVLRKRNDSKLPFLLLASLLIPIVLRTSISWKLTLLNAMIFAILFLSLVVLTGFSGQISFGHTAFMGIAAFSAAHLAGGHVGVWGAFAIGGLCTVPAGVLIGLASVRFHGLYLALLTLAFAFMAQELFFSKPWISGAEGRLLLARPEAFHGDTSFSVLVLVTLVLFTGLARNLRSGRIGRVLAAVGDSEAGARALGIHVARIKIAIFALSAFMAGTGAILAAMAAGEVARLDFLPFYSLVYVAVAVIGGLYDIGGAIIAGLVFAVYPQIFRTSGVMLRLELVLFGLAAAIMIVKHPDGLYGIARRATAAGRTLTRGAHSPRVKAENRI